MTAKDILACARELLSDPARWNKEHFAYSGDGDVVDYNDENAVSWCLVGAIAKCSNKPPGVATREWTTAFQLVESEARETMPPQKWYSVAAFNDNTTHEQVLEVLDKALEAA